ncbi:MAG: peptidylprolyl isomerase [Candidatus Marinimicrobia bacterium]|nr:peptidylprolyl isomerase [Candidatus Neomarinimicrobiota bacterium]
MFNLNCVDDKTYLLISTELGDIRVEIYTDKAPVTAANFLEYVDKNSFRNSKFYRVVRDDNQPDNEVKIDVIQGGLYSEEKMFTPIEHETTDRTGIRHLDGVISMARNEPGSASSEFFICIGDQPELDYGGKRNPDGQGFAAFGKVVDGMDIVRKIHQQPADGQMLAPEIRINTVRRFK